MTNAIVHIGFGKTGSTAIQKWLYDNSQALSDYGYLYSTYRDSSVYSWNLHAEICLLVYEELDEFHPNGSVAFGFGLKNRRHQSEICNKFQEKVSYITHQNKHKTFILSSEYLERAGQSEEFALALHKVLSKIFCNIKVAVYIRRQEDEVLSRFSQSAKFKAEVDLDSFLDRYNLKCYQSMISRIESAFNRENINLRLAAPDIICGKSIFEDFCSILEMPLDKVTKAEQLNKSPSAASLEILRHFNKDFRPHLYNGYPNPYYRNLRSALEKIDAEFSRPSLSKEQIEKIRLSVHDGNDWVKRAYFPERTELFPHNNSTTIRDVSIEDELAVISSELLKLSAKGKLWRFGIRDFLELLRSKFVER